MKLQISGGTRRARGRAIPVPVPKNMRANKFGNIVRGKILKLLADKKKYFSGVPKGISGDAGIWERMGKGGHGRIRMIIAWEPKADYRKRYPFKSLVEKAVNNNFK